MAAEIERKFLLDEKPEWLSGCESKEMEQGYLVVGERDEVRLRRAGDSLRMTVKRGHGMSRDETEIDLEPRQFAELWPLTEGRRVAKTRYLVPLDDGLTAEVDLYGEEHGGLMVVEVEFGSEPQSHAFEPPDWFGRDVTGRREFSNQRLALEGFSRPA
ncbi:MAG TPA: CYTH domain-containing protein [Solirubrobacterales bacterium]|nr:CYTH domain-containing protein [Solirubrobacterales bacterium]